MKQPRRLTITNTQSITDWQIVMLKRQKSYAVAALGESKGKVKNLLFFIIILKSTQNNLKKTNIYTLELIFTYY